MRWQTFDRLMAKVERAEEIVNRHTALFVKQRQFCRERAALSCPQRLKKLGLAEERGKPKPAACPQEKGRLSRPSLKAHAGSPLRQRRG